MGERELSTADHPRSVKEERRDRKKYWYDANYVKLRVIIGSQVDFYKRLFLRIKHMVSFLKVRGAMVTVVVLAAT